jgi:cell division septal protein FtsQ
MSAKKAKSKPGAALLPPPIKQLIALFTGPGRAAAMILLILAVFSGSWYAVWRSIGLDVLTSKPYWLGRKNVEVTPPPAWIHRDIRGEVFRDASLDGPLSIMDDDLAQRIADAFSLHPWVAEVRRVVKCYPAGVRVDLAYRRPVCMVELGGRLLAVDVEGVLLPSGSPDFSPTEKLRYPRLVGVDTVPVTPGARWADARVVEGAEIADALGPVWQQLSLDRIVPSTLVELGYGDEYTYELVTKGGTRILWGRAPSAQMPGEATAAEKIAQLLDYHKANRTLEGPSGPQQLDVRNLRAPQSTPRTAGREAEGGNRSGI